MFTMYGVQCGDTRLRLCRSYKRVVAVVRSMAEPRVDCKHPHPMSLNYRNVHDKVLFVL